MLVALIRWPKKYVLSVVVSNRTSVVVAIFVPSVKSGVFAVPRGAIFVALIFADPLTSTSKITPSRMCELVTSFG